MQEGQARSRTKRSAFARAEKRLWACAGGDRAFWGLESDSAAKHGQPARADLLVSPGYDCRRQRAFQNETNRRVK